jgi:hypothetical protein
MSGVVEINFKWERYSQLKASDFMDDLTVVQAQDLFGPGEQE